MKRYLKLYIGLIRVYLRNVVAYRAIIALWAIAGVVQTYVALAIWRAVESAGGTPADFTGDAVATYFIAVMLMDELTHSWTYWAWEWYARTGRFAGKLSHPIHPLNADVADNLAVKIVSMAVKIPIAVVSLWAMGISLPSPGGPGAALGAAIAIVGAYTLRTMLEACVACLAFEVTRMGAIVMTWSVIWLFLAGSFAPTRLLPGIAGDIAAVLPLRWALEFPVRALVGELTEAQIMQGIGIQMLWICVTAVLFRALWARGLRRYAAVGG